MENRLSTARRPRPGLRFHLAQSSLKKIHAVVLAYLILGRPAALQEVVNESQQSQGTVRNMLDFLADMGILGGISKRRQLRPIGMDLGRAIKSRKGDAVINRAWKRAVCQNRFCIQVLRDARAEGKVDKNRLVYLIFTAAGYRTRDLSHDYTTGAKALISIFRRAGVVRRSKGYFTVSRSVERIAENLRDEVRRDDDYIFQDHIACLEQAKAEGQAALHLSWLFAYSNELNDNYRRGNTLSVSLLCRAILEQLSAIFGEPALEGPTDDLRALAADVAETITVSMDAHEATRAHEGADCRDRLNFLIGRAIELAQSAGERAP